MKPKTIKLIFITITLSILLSIVIFLLIKFFQEKKSNEMLLDISGITEIQNQLASFHFKYGKYPLASSDIIINKSVLCNSGFQYNKNDCDEIFWEPKDFKIDFIYNRNETGEKYSIRFDLKDDNKYLGCVHDKKEKKKGCSFTLDLIDGLKVIK
ncbi:MAG TPA: hypothetical protein PLM63_00030 [bacterium]|nr:hypothetical protein [bacterium]HPO10964.1 hypothetical protein [bacterium]